MFGGVRCIEIQYDADVADFGGLFLVHAVNSRLDAEHSQCHVSNGNYPP